MNARELVKVLGDAMEEEGYLQAKCIRETAKAFLVEILEEDGNEKWIPKSQIHEGSEVYGKDHEGKLIVSA